MNAGIPYIALFFALALSARALAGPTDPPDEALRALLQLAVEDSSSFTDRYEAEVWLTDMSTRLARAVPDNEKRLELLSLIHQEATRAKLPPELVLAVIEVESYFERWAISEAGALGLMQIMPFWRDEIGHPEANLFQVRTNLRFGCTILRYYLDLERGDLTRGLARYNGSLGSPEYPRKVLTALSERWFRE
jgi:soluble lytic murein transglycosylase-like protein